MPLAVLAAAGLAAYANSFRGAFVYDDLNNIVTNPVIRRPEALWMGWPLRPHVLFESFALNYRFGGLDPWGYHALNLAIHVLAALVLWGIVRRALLSGRLCDRFGRDSWALALAVAGLWLVHPLQTEAVTYVVQRRESMTALCLLLTLYAVIRGAASRYAPLWYAGAVFWCWLGMNIKAVMVVAPVMVLLWDRALLAGSLRGALGRRWLLYVLLAATAWPLVQGSYPRLLASGLGVSSMQMSILDYARTQFAVVAHYLRLAVWPDSLCLAYEWPVARTWAEVLPQAALIGVLLALAAWAFWRRPAAGFLGVWLFGNLAPTSSVITIPRLAFEHRMYLALAAIVALAVLGGYAVGARLLARYLPQEARRRRAGAVAGACLVLLAGGALAARTVLRNEDYRTPVVMWTDVVTKCPGNWRAWNNLGLALMDAGQVDPALASYRQSVALRPGYADAWFNVALAWARKGDEAAAAECLRRTLALAPDDPKANLNLAVALGAKGDLEAAAGHLETAVRAKPDYALAWLRLGEVRMRQGRWAEAARLCREALRLGPDDPETLNALAWVLAAAPDGGVRDGPEAVRLASRAAERTSFQDPVILDTLAAAYAETGQFEDAARTAREALRLAPGSGPKGFSEDVRARLAAYESGRPWREPSVPGPEG